MGKTNVLVLGNGMREHAIVKQLYRSNGIGNIFTSPGNTGTEKLGKNVSVETIHYGQDPDVFARYDIIEQENIDLVIIGSDARIVEGEADAFLDLGCSVFGPEMSLARLEGSKIYAREVMRHLDIPSPKWHALHSIEGVRCAIRDTCEPYVLKKDGLAMGKGVKIFQEQSEGLTWAEEHFAQKQEPILMEERLIGTEVSMLALCDGKTFVLFPPIMDHKHSHDGNTGSMTGGMGCVAPAPLISPKRWTQMGQIAVAPILRWAKEKTERGYRGCLFVNWMLTADGPKVLEFNARFGDPEIQTAFAIIPTAYDWLQHFQWCAEGTLSDHGYKSGNVITHGWSAVTVVIAGARYPDFYECIRLSESHLSEPPQGIGVCLGNNWREASGLIYWEGGRVLSITASADSVAKAAKLAYGYARSLNIPNTRFRTDIGSHVPSL